MSQRTRKGALRTGAPEQRHDRDEAGREAPRRAAIFPESALARLLRHPHERIEIFRSSCLEEVVPGIQNIRGVDVEFAEDVHREFERSGPRRRDHISVGHGGGVIVQRGAAVVRREEVVPRIARVPDGVECPDKAIP